MTKHNKESRKELRATIHDQHAALVVANHRAARAEEERDAHKCRAEEYAAALRTIKRMRPSVNGSERAKEIAAGVLG